MDSKRLASNNNIQNNNPRVNKGVSKTQVIKNTSNVSLTPSQVAEQAKLNERKHPFDALSKTTIKQTTVERRSGLQEVDEEYLKQNIFRKPFVSRNSGLYGDISQNPMANTPATGQTSNPPSEGITTNQVTSQAQIKSHQNYPHQQAEGNFVSPQIQIPSQCQNATGTFQQNQQSMNAKNQLNNPTMFMQQQDSNQQQHYHQQQIATNQNAALHGNNHPGQVLTSTYNNNTPISEPELCTTCPNCQTTIYLVRSPEMKHEVKHQESNNCVQHTIGDNVAVASAGSA
ncbi:uncharacterized protein ACRADG_002695 isoform 1-T1 [Cochliomyia hominivorax]